MTETKKQDTDFAGLGTVMGTLHAQNLIATLAASCMPELMHLPTKERRSKAEEIVNTCSTVANLIVKHVEKNQQFNKPTDTENLTN